MKPPKRKTSKKSSFQQKEEAKIMKMLAQMSEEQRNNFRDALERSRIRLAAIIGAKL